jgi:hypothetical protein
MVCVVDTGMPSAVARNRVIAPPVSAQKAADGLELGDALTHGLDDPPAAEHRAQADGDVAAPDHPGRRHGGVRLGVAGGDQQHPDDADRLLRIVAAVPEAVEPGRDELHAAEQVVDPERRGAAEEVGDQHH